MFAHEMCCWHGLTVSLLIVMYPTDHYTKTSEQ